MPTEGSGVGLACGLDAMPPTELCDPAPVRLTSVLLIQFFQHIRSILGRYRCSKAGGFHATEVGVKPAHIQWNWPVEGADNWVVAGMTEVKL